MVSDKAGGAKKASEAISEHQIFKNFSWGSMPPHPPSLILRILVQGISTSQSNAILLMPGLHFCEYA